jgi:diguanylate cyclase (GGDEF)-like protein
MKAVIPSGSEDGSTAASPLSAVADLFARARRLVWTRSRDVTVALFELDAKLEERVRERTAELEAEIERYRLGESKAGRRGSVDELTRLPHRRVFRQRVEQTLLQRQRDGGLAALLFVDLEGFRRINETRGRDQGDDVLIEVAQRLSRCVRRSDVATRLEAGTDESVMLRQGGDEFMILLSHLRAAEDVALVAQRVIDAIGAPLVLARKELQVGASVGIALYPMHGKDGEALIKTANAALHMARSRQPGHFAFFDTRIHERVAERLQLEEELRRGISSDQLVLHYQPKINVTTGAVDGVEALVRWQHPTRGLMLPNSFLPLAERSGLIHLLGDRVIEAACRQAAEWWRRDCPLRVAINLSAQQIATGRLDEHVGSLLDATGLPAHLLELEVTEATLESVGVVAIEQLCALRDRGAHVTLEDSGTGCTFADSLEKLPVDTVKLDRAFVESLDENFGAVEKVVETARTLGLLTAAEGVEERDQVRRLVIVGCDLLQGFYFGTPSPSGEIESANEQAAARFAESGVAP